MYDKETIRQVEASVIMMLSENLDGLMFDEIEASMSWDDLPLTHHASVLRKALSNLIVNGSILCVSKNRNGRSTTVYVSSNYWVRLPIYGENEYFKKVL